VIHPPPDASPDPSRSKHICQFTVPAKLKLTMKQIDRESAIRRYLHEAKKITLPDSVEIIVREMSPNEFVVDIWEVK